MDNIRLAKQQLKNRLQILSFLFFNIRFSKFSIQLDAL